MELEDNVRLDIACLEAGGNPGRCKRASTLINDSRIANFTRDLNDGEISIDVFLRRASRRLQSSFNHCLKLGNARPIAAIPVDGEDQDSDIDGDGKFAPMRDGKGWMGRRKWRAGDGGQPSPPAI